MFHLILVILKHMQLFIYFMINLHRGINYSYHWLFRQVDVGFTSWFPAGNACLEINIIVRSLSLNFNLFEPSFGIFQ